MIMLLARWLRFRILCRMTSDAEIEFWNRVVLEPQMNTNGMFVKVAASPAFVLSDPFRG